MRARRLAFCRRCNQDTAQVFLSTDQPNVELWRCHGCRSTLMSIADIPDADGFACAVAETWMGRNSIHLNGGIEREEVYAQARADLWLAFQKWDPARGLTFRSYASWKTGALLTDWIREQRGRTYGDDHAGIKPHADAVSLDAPHDDDLGEARLDSLVGAVSGDPARHRSPDLSRALELRGSRHAREERSVGGAAYARAS